VSIDIQVEELKKILQEVRGGEPGEVREMKKSSCVIYVSV